MAPPQARWPVSVLGAVRQVSRRGCYADGQRPASAGAGAEEAALCARVQASAAETPHRSGRRRMATPLPDEGLAVGRCTARWLMQQAGVAVRRARRRHPVTTTRRHGDGVAPNLLARQVAVECPEPVWVGASTSRWTAVGWLDGSVRLALYARQVVGGARRSRRDATMGQEALHMALGRRKPSAGLMPQADRGSPDAGHADPRLRGPPGIRWRLSRTGEGVAKAGAERVCGSLPRERTAHRAYATRPDASDEVIDAREMFSNRRRKHS